MNRRQFFTQSCALLTGVTFGGNAAAATTASQNLAKPPPRVLPPQAFASLARLTGRYIADRKIAGAAFAIGRHNYQADFMAWGRSGLSSGQFINEHSIFRIYSMTKPVTAAAAMLLIDDGLLGLDQPVADFLPAFARLEVLVDPSKGLQSRPAKRPLTIRHLLTHTGGFAYPDAAGGPVQRAYYAAGLIPTQRNRASERPRPASLQKFAETLAPIPLLADPGDQWHYGIGLDLLGAVIEIASSTAFETFLKQRLFTPLGMKDTGFEVPARAIPRLVNNYLATPDGLKLFDPAPTSIFTQKPPFAYGGAGLVSTAADYARFTAMLLGKGNFAGRQIMSEHAAQTMLSNLLPADVIGPDGQGYGGGGQILIRANGTGQALGTYSWAGVGGTLMWVDPAHKVHGLWLAQYLPIDALPVQYAVPRAVYEDLSRQ